MGAYLYESMLGRMLNAHQWGHKEMVGEVQKYNPDSASDSGVVGNQNRALKVVESIQHSLELDWRVNNEVAEVRGVGGKNSVYVRFPFVDVGFLF